MRLQKYMAMCGVAARRKCEEIIASGRVSVNGKIITEMGTQVEEGDRVELDGVLITLEEEKRYILYHKPAGEVTTVSDDKGRETVMDRFSDFPERIYPVGRLDYDSEGLLLLTNDGELALRMTHPRYGIEKCYIASIRDHVTGEAIQRLRQGVVIDGKMTAPAKVRRLESEGVHEKLEVIIREGRNRQVRKMLEAVGNSVVRLVRVSEGPIQLRGLKVGQWRELSQQELYELRKALKFEDAVAPAPRGGRNAERPQVHSTINPKRPAPANQERPVREARGEAKPARNPVYESKRFTRPKKTYVWRADEEGKQ